MKEIWHKNKLYILGLICVIVTASVPLMTDYVLYGSSLAVSLSRIEIISKHFGDVFPIRVATLGDLTFGYSATAFAGDVFYLFPALLYKLGMGMSQAYRLTLFFLHVLTALVAYYSVKKAFGTPELGLLGAMLFTWNPYRISSVYQVGDLGEIAAWIFLPLVLLGLKNLIEKKKAWVYLTIGFSFIAVSSATVLLLSVMLTVFFLLVCIKDVWNKTCLAEVGKTFLSTLSLNAWFLGPMILRMRDPNAVAPMLIPDIRENGLYLMQYFNVFAFGGNNTALAENGMVDALAVGPGVVVLLALFYGLLIWYLQKVPQEGKAQYLFWKKLVFVGGIFVLFSLSAFPWDVFANKNMLFSIFLALLNTPAKFGMIAGVVFIFAACVMLACIKKETSNLIYKRIVCVAVLLSFGSTQFLTGKILTCQNFVRDDAIQKLSAIEFPVIMQESVVWRLCEAISVISFVVCIGSVIVKSRLRKGGKHV